MPSAAGARRECTRAVVRYARPVLEVHGDPSAELAVPASCAAGTIRSASRWSGTTIPRRARSSRRSRSRPTSTATRVSPTAASWRRFSTRPRGARYSSMATSTADGDGQARGAVSQAHPTDTPLLLVGRLDRGGDQHAEARAELAACRRHHLGTRQGAAGAPAGRDQQPLAGRAGRTGRSTSSCASLVRGRLRSLGGARRRNARGSRAERDLSFLLQAG